MEPNSTAHNVIALKPSPLQGELLQAIRAATQLTLPPILAGVLAGADDALFDLVQKSHSTFEQQQFFDAMRELRRQRAAIDQRYRDHFVSAFAGLEKRKPMLAHYSQPGEASNELSLLDEEELEEQLASEQVAQAVERRHLQVLSRLDMQMGVVAGGLTLDGTLNPIGPGHMAAAMRAALRGCDLASSARLVLFKLYEQALLPALTKFYADTSARLTAAGIGGIAAKAAPRPTDAPATAANQPPPANEYLAPEIPKRDEGRVRDDLFAALHGLLEDYRATQRATGHGQVAGSSAGGAPLAATEALTVLSLLQRELPATVHAAVNDPRQSLSDQLKRELVAQAERMGVGRPGAGLAAGDEDAIDLVGMLFEVLLNERKFQDQVRRLLTQMIVPFAKVAMLDRRMFMHKTHPARRMLNSVAEACDGNTGETALERELLDRVQQLVDRLVAEFNEDLAIFETLQEEFGSFLEQHRKRVELAERRAAEAQRGRERLEQARAVASMELAMLMGARDAPPMLDAFLRRYWNHHLALVILRDGTDSERFVQARAGGEQLWQHMLRAESGQADIGSLEGIIEPILSSSGVTGEAARDVVRAMSSLFEHMQRGDRASVDSAVLPGLAAVPPATEATAPAGAANNVIPLRPGTESARRVGDGSASGASAGRDTAAQFASFWADSARIEAPTPEVPATAARDTSTPALSVVGGTASVEADPADIEKIRKLEIGNWVEMIGEDGSAQPAKLSWVSPISNRLLFVNRRGMRVCAASAEELAVMLKQGKLSLREIDTAFERAMTQVLGKLRESQSQRGSA